MPQEPLVIEDLPGPKDGQRLLRLTGPLTMSTLFDFQSRVRTDSSRVLMLDFAKVPYVDSAGIGALVGAYVTHHKDGRSLYLIGERRVQNALKVTDVESSSALSIR
jgi:anti-sigma B factor antagonist